MIERVLQNLIGNAIKNTPENEQITIELQQRNQQLIAIFENDGKPMSQALLNWINSSEKTNVLQSQSKPHTGLGLMIVKRILELHNSKLIADSNTGLSNRFLFVLPVYINS